MRPSLLVLSHVLPFPRSGGQQQRVYYTLQAAREKFDVTFTTSAIPEESDMVRAELSRMCDQVLLLPDVREPNRMTKTWHRLAGSAFSAYTGLKRSNYDIGRVQFTPERIGKLLDGQRFSCVLFEYWHAAAAVAVFRQLQMPCVLDMHNILWQAYKRQLETRPNLPQAWKRYALHQYRMAEEHSWRQFDALIAINREEERYVTDLLGTGKQVFYAAMGTDLDLWPYSWEPARPAPRVAYYGSLASVHNQEGAMNCAREVMPKIWARHPAVELWIVGHNPSPAIRGLADEDSRIHVTGFVDRVQAVLKTMTAVICPWSGTYGFRSRVVEVMALGTPVVASPDAVSGMELVDGQGLLLGADLETLARLTLQLLEDDELASTQSRLARAQVERLFSLQGTYIRLVDELEQWICES